MKNSTTSEHTSDAVDRELRACAELVSYLDANTTLFQDYPDLLAHLRRDPATTALPRILEVLSNERVVGWLVDVNDVWCFQYAPTWLNDSASYAISPGLPLQPQAYLDGSTNRPVQWYFDNLLPEEELLKVLAKDAHLDFHDAFGLLRHYGSESAGSLVLRPLASPLAETGFRELTRDALNARIQSMTANGVPLTHEAPKRMSLAGAQHKMVVIATSDALYEPLAGTPSTHILKPNSPSTTYPHSVINEFFVMTLANAVGVPVPNVRRAYLPEPVYLVERFDRVVHRLDVAANIAEVDRTHIVDTCQLLNTSRIMKYSDASLETLSKALGNSRTRVRSRLDLYSWLVFNVLIGNADNHLKNISWLVTSDGVRLAPFYDLLSTAVYDTPGYASTLHSDLWPRSQLALPLTGANLFSDVTYSILVKAGHALGLGSTAPRVLDGMLRSILPKARTLLNQLEQQNQAPASAEFFSPTHAPNATKGGELHLLRSIVYVVLTDMVTQIETSRNK